MHRESVLEPIFKWSRKSQVVFLDSMSDVYHARVSADFHGRLFATMALTPQHSYQVLTKRPGPDARSAGRRRPSANGDDGCPVGSWPQQSKHADMEHPLAVRADRWGCPWPLPNVWLGTSIESDEYAWRADDLRKTPAAVRFLSLEPLLGPLPRLDLGGFDQVITGGESGPGARPMDPHWARTIRNQCRAKGVAFLHKQTVNGQQQASTVPGFCTAQGFTAQQRRTLRTDSCSTKSCSVGKKAAGRELDGHTWDEFPMPFERRDSA